MIESVKVVNVDDSLKSSGSLSMRMGGRILEVKSKKKGSFSTPTRPMSLPEFKAKAMLAFDEALDGHLGGVQIDLKGERFARFMKRNGTVNRAKMKMTKFSNLTCCFENFVVLDVPSIPPSDIGTFKLLFDMQSKIRLLDYVSLPPIASGDLRPFDRLIREWKREAETRGKGVIPQLSMSEDLDSFKAKLDLLSEMAESGEIQIINLVYANPESHLHQFIEIWKRHDMKAIFNCSSVPSRGKEVAQNLYETQVIELQKYGVDTFTPITKTPSQKYVVWLQHREGPKTVMEIDDFLWAHHPGGAIMEKDLWHSLPSDNVECPCKVCKGKDQKGMIDEYCYDERGELTSYGMYSAARLHDAMSSQLEYSIIRNRIKSGEMNDYVSGLDEYRRTKLRL